MKVLLNNIFAFFALFSCSVQGGVVESRENFLIIEASQKNVRAVCEGNDPETVFFGVYAVLNEVLYDFFFRSPLDKETCEKLKLKYHKMIKGVPTIVLAGHAPSINKDFSINSKNNPKNLGKYSRMVSAMFVRMNAGSACEPFFNDGFDPDQYWGNVRPGKEKKY